MIVVGSRNSSNSVRLVEVALDAGAKAAHLVDYAREVDPAWLDGVAHGRAHVGCVGAGDPGARGDRPARRARFRTTSSRSPPPTRRWSSRCRASCARRGADGGVSLATPAATARLLPHGASALERAARTDRGSGPAESGGPASSGSAGSGASRRQRSAAPVVRGGGALPGRLLTWRCWRRRVARGVAARRRRGRGAASRRCAARRRRLDSGVGRGAATAPAAASRRGDDRAARRGGPRRPWRQHHREAVDQRNRDVDQPGPSARCRSLAMKL